VSKTNRNVQDKEKEKYFKKQFAEFLESYFLYIFWLYLVWKKIKYIDSENVTWCSHWKCVCDNLQPFTTNNILTKLFHSLFVFKEMIKYYSKSLFSSWYQNSVIHFFSLCLYEM